MAGSFARCICHSHIVQITVDSQQSCRLDWRDLLRIGYVQAVRGQCDGPDICSVQNGDCVGAEFYLDLAWEVQYALLHSQPVACGGDQGSSSAVGDFNVMVSQEFSIIRQYSGGPGSCLAGRSIRREF